MLPERHIIEGRIYNTNDEVYPARDIESPFGAAYPDGYGWPLRNLLERLEGKHVRITVEVVEDSPEGAPDAP